MKSKAVEVNLKQAEKIRLFLTKNNYLRKDLKLFRKGKNIYFPIKEFKNVLFELNS